MLSNTTWWTRSSANNNSYYIWTVSETGYLGHRSYADGTAQLVPAFVVGMASDSNPQITINESLKLYNDGLKELELAQKLLEEAKLVFVTQSNNS